MMQTFLLKLKFELLTIDLLFAVVSIGQAVVSIGVSVGVGSIGVREGGVVVGSIAVVSSPDSRVVDPGVGLGVSLSIGSGLSDRLSLSLLHKVGRDRRIGCPRAIRISRPFSVVGVGKTIVSIGVSVGVGSIGVGKGGIVVGSIAIVSSIESRVVQPGVSLGVSLSLGSGLSSGLGLSLLNRDGRGLFNSSSGGGSHNSWGYETSMGAGDESSIIVGASSIGHHMSIGKSVVGIGVGEDTGGGVGEGRVSLGLSGGRGSEGYHQQELHVDDLR